jgi:hypothetical protein
MRSIWDSIARLSRGPIEQGPTDSAAAALIPARLHSVGSRIPTARRNPSFTDVLEHADDRAIAA